MSNKDRLQTNNTKLSTNNNDLLEVLDYVNNLPSDTKPEIGFFPTKYSSSGYISEGHYYGEEVPDAYMSTKANREVSSLTIFTGLRDIYFHNTRSIGNYGMCGINLHTLYNTENLQHLGEYSLSTNTNTDAGMRVKNSYIYLPNLKWALQYSLRDYRTLGTYGTYYWLGASVQNDFFKDYNTNKLEHDKWENGVWEPQKDGTWEKASDQHKWGFLDKTNKKLYDIQEYMTYTVSLTSSHSTPYRIGCIIYDENLNQIIYYNNYATSSKITTPKGARYLLICSYYYNLEALISSTSNYFKMTTTGVDTKSGLNRYTFSTNTSKIYIDLPRSVVETFDNYNYAFMDSTSSTSKAKIVCNDDEDFVTEEEFKELLQEGV